MTDASATGRPRRRGSRSLVVAGLLAAILAVLTSVLPVSQRTASLSWPQGPSWGDVTAPLVAYTPSTLTATVSCAVVRALPGDATVLATAPPAAPGSDQVDLRVSARNGDVVVAVRGQQAARVPLASLDDGPSCAVEVSSDARVTTVTVGPTVSRLTGDVRPQVVGVYTDLRGATRPGVSLRAELDTRYDSRPTLLKLFVMVTALAALVVALLALRRCDRELTYTPPRTRRGRWRPGWSDAVVISVLVAWALVGSTTSDDGYLETMARASGSSGFTGNYFRWFDVAEAPFGWWYELFGTMVEASTATVWLRLPAVLTGVLAWLLVSRGMLARIGPAAHVGPARWAAAGVLLATWLPFDSGLRPETPIAVGLGLTWLLVERALASRALLPLAGALLAGSFSLAAGPTGIAALAVLAVASRPIAALVRERARGVGWVAAGAPLLAAGTAVLVVVFADQSLATVREATRVRTALGPSLPWYREPQRYTALLVDSPDGSLARRFAVLLLLMVLAASAAVLLRRGTLPGTARGPTTRVVGATAAGLAALVLTPTKWTHHFGAFAVLAAAVAAVATVAVGPTVLRQLRARAAVAAAAFVLLAFTLTGTNDWWYVSSYGVPFAHRAPVVAGVSLSTVALGAAAVAAAVAAREHLRPSPRTTPWRRSWPGRVGGIVGAPVTVVSFIVVGAVLASFLVSVLTRWPAYTVGQQALRPGSCGLADQVLVEQPPSSGALSPADTADPLDPGTSGFRRSGVPSGLLSDLPDQTGTGTATAADAVVRGGGSGAQDTSFSAPLPDGLDPATTAILGSWSGAGSSTTTLTTGWWALPPAAADQPVVAVTAAGFIDSFDPTGVPRGGAQLDLEYGSGAPDAVSPTGSVRLQDPTGGPSWRTLRVARDRLPADTTWVRLVARDALDDPAQWVAFTAPRAPTLIPLQQALGRDAPVLLDWSVGQSFPCLRPLTMAEGVAEPPVARITPGETALPSDTTWQAASGGGPLGWTGLVARGRVLTSYLEGDWGREWGTVITYTPWTDSTPARLDLGSATVSGLRGPPDPQWLPPIAQRDR